MREYTLEREGAVEYVIVQCPDGHLNRGQKVNDMTLRVVLVCAVPSCSLSWSQTIPVTMQFEAVP